MWQGEVYIQVNLLKRLLAIFAFPMNFKWYVWPTIMICAVWCDIMRMTTYIRTFFLCCFIFFLLFAKVRMESLMTSKHRFLNARILMLRQRVNHSYDVKTFYFKKCFSFYLQRNIPRKISSCSHIHFLLFWRFVSGDLNLSPLSSVHMCYILYTQVYSFLQQSIIKYQFRDSDKMWEIVSNWFLPTCQVSGQN